MENEIEVVPTTENKSLATNFKDAVIKEVVTTLCVVAITAVATPVIKAVGNKIKARRNAKAELHVVKTEE